MSDFCNLMNCNAPGSSVLPYLSAGVCSNSCANLLELMWVGDATQPSHPLPPYFLLPSIFPSSRVFSNELALHIMWPKYWSFSFSISPFNEYSGLISFRTDWFDLVVQKTLKSSLAPQFKSINSSALSLLYSPTLTSLHDYWKSHRFDYTDLCQHSDVSTF